MKLKNIKLNRLLILALGGLLIVGCQKPAPPAVSGSGSNTSTTVDASSEGGETSMSIATSSFGKTTDEQEVTLYTCTNANGRVMKMIDYGAIVVSMEMPDRDGKLANITLGFDKIDGYLQRHPYFGATVGRYCNRIAKGRFSIDGTEYELARNNDPNHLHGGDKGFDQYVWDAEEVETDDAVGVRFTRTSADGEEGYPGNLKVTATYLLTNDDEMKVELEATTDAKTPVNLTNHCYWNLAGAGQGTILDHELTVEADEYLPVDNTLIPTGELADVTSTALDFTSATTIGARIAEMTGDPGGYDHCYVLRSQDGSLAKAATVKDPSSGRVMEIYTTQPGIQFYTGNFLDGTEGSGGFPKNGALCLETQHYPDSPNQEGFPNTILQPGETLRHTTVHKFRTE